MTNPKYGGKIIKGPTYRDIEKLLDLFRTWPYEKEDITAKQQEPIFFAHAEKVGLDTKKRVCENYLFNSGHDIISRYRDFKKAVLSSYEGLNFKREKFEKLKIGGA